MRIVVLSSPPRLDSGESNAKDFPMRQEGILKHIAAALVIAVVFYFVTFTWIERRRAANGPWQITFRSDVAGVPALSIAESKLNISQTVQFPRGKTTPNLSQTITFGTDPPDLPFGELVYHDPTFLPGAVTMRLFGHQFELVPRVLYIDGKEHLWHSNNVITVQ
jgi:hypothetical protein